MLAAGHDRRSLARGNIGGNGAVRLDVLDDLWGLDDSAHGHAAVCRHLVIFRDVPEVFDFQAAFVALSAVIGHG